MAPSLPRRVRPWSSLAHGSALLLLLLLPVTASCDVVPHAEARIAYARAHAESVGRTAPLDICFVPFGLSMHRPERIDAGRFHETVERLAQLGVTWLTLALPGDDLAAFCDTVARFGEDVLGPLRAG